MYSFGHLSAELSQWWEDKEEGGENTKGKRFCSALGRGQNVTEVGRNQNNAGELNKGYEMETTVAID